jgi:hypothetical protein
MKCILTKGLRDTLAAASLEALQGAALDLWMQALDYPATPAKELVFKIFLNEDEPLRRGL